MHAAMGAHESHSTAQPQADTHIPPYRGKMWLRTLCMWNSHFSSVEGTQQISLRLRARTPHAPSANGGLPFTVTEGEATYGEAAARAARSCSRVR